MNNGSIVNKYIQFRMFSIHPVYKPQNFGGSGNIALQKIDLGNRSFCFFQFVEISSAYQHFVMYSQALSQSQAIARRAAGNQHDLRRVHADSLAAYEKRAGRDGPPHEGRTTDEPLTTNH